MSDRDREVYDLAGEAFDKERVGGDNATCSSVRGAHRDGVPLP